MKKKILFLGACLMFFATLNGQNLVTQTESNEGTIFPAPGWKPQKGLHNLATNIGAFTNVNAATATNPSIGSAPSGGGSKVLMFNSFSSGINDDCYLISKPFDFSNNAGSNPTFSFWMYRDAGSPGINDKIEVFWNSTSDTTGMIAIMNGSGVNYINRPIGSFPTVVTAGWYQYTFTLPAAMYTAKKNYFIVHATSAFGQNIYLDKFTCNTYPSAMNLTDVTFDLVQQNTATTSQGATNQWILGVRCIVGGSSGCGNLNGPLPIKLDELLFNTNGTTNIANITKAKVYYTGGSNLFSTGYVSPFPTTGNPTSTIYPVSQYGSTITAIGTNLTFSNSSSNCFYLEYDTTYFWIAYDVSSNSIQGNQLDADFLGASIGGSISSCPTPIGAFTSVLPTTYSLLGALSVDVPYCIPTYTVGTAQNNYINNDFLQSVELVGYGGTSINTSTNSVSLQNPSLSCYPNCKFTKHPPDYELRSATVTNQTATLLLGGSYSIAVQSGTAPSGNNISVWIDYNHDSDFQDQGEFINTASLLANSTVSYNFTVPSSALIGKTRMRVREVYAVTNPDPCLNYTYGECEDFEITITPNCFSGYKLWMGYDNDWNNPANWCPSIPTINDDVVINKALTSTTNYYNPVIKSSVFATCKNILIAVTDTLTIDAPNPSAASFKAKGTVTNNGQIRFTTSYTPSINVATGTLLNFTQTPLPGKTYKAGQTQIIYTAAELAGYGMLAGDQITAIKLNVKNNDLVTPTRTYNGFSISYLNTAAVFSAYANTTAIAGAFTTVYNNAAQPIVFGVNTLTLGTPITWDGVNNICIQYCYTNVGTTGSTNNDYIDVTQTTGRNSVLILGRLIASAAGAPAACSFVAPVAGDITANGGTTATAIINVLSQFRPNATFVLSRPYGKPRMVVQGDWINNNSFVAENSSFVMDSSVTNHIGGTQPSTFNTFVMFKTSAGVNTADNRRPIILDNNITIQDTFYLTSGQMIMNGKSLTMNNPRPSAFWRTQLVQASGTPAGVGTGFLISENSASVVNWNIGVYASPTSARAIPFGNRQDTTTAAITYMPVTFLHKSGDLGTFKAGMKYWAANAPITDPPTVTHINIYNSTANNAAQTADRYWMIGKTGPQNPAVNYPVVDLTFRFSNNAAPATERPTVMSAINQGRAQPWRAGSEQWMRITANTLLNVYTIPVGGVSANGSTITYTSSVAHAIVVGQAVTMTGITPAGYNIVGGIVTAVTATTFTILNSTNLGPSTVAGTVTGAPAAGATNYNAQQTSVNYGQTYTQVAAQALDSVKITSWDWPTAPAQGLPSNYPLAPVGDFTPWTITNNNTPLGEYVALTPISVSLNNSINASCPNTSDGSISISVSGGSQPYSYLWNNGTTTQNLNNLLAGTYTITVTDASSQTTSSTFTIQNNNSLPGTIGNISGSSSFCLPTNSTFSVIPVANATNYQWTTPPNTSILSGQGTNSVIVSFNSIFTSGNICVVASNTCGTSNSTCYSVTGALSSATTPSSITGNNYGVCNSAKTYSVINVNGNTYQWNVPIGASIISGQGTNAISVSFLNSFTSGAITVAAINGCGNSSLRTKTIYGKPNKPTTISGLSSFCAGDTVSFSCNIVSGSTYYVWSIPSSAVIISGQGTNIIKLKCIGGINNGSVCVKASNNCGTSGSICFTINVTGIPAAISSITGTANGVCNSTVTYSVPNQVGVQFNWLAPTGSTIQTGQGFNSISVLYNSSFVSGIITVTASSPCGVSTTLSKTIKGIPAIPTSINGPTSVCSNQSSAVYNCTSSTGATSYDWTAPAGTIFNSGQGTSTVNVSFNAAVGTSSPIKVRANNACGSSSYKSLNLTFSQCFARTKSEVSEINLYPNPASDELVVDIGNASLPIKKIEILNVLGQTVYEEVLLIQSQNTKVNTSGFSEGLYLVSVTSEDNITKTVKLIIERQ